ncbi:MAG: peptidase M66, partial [Opitutales bacterium]|nr:peptidase M66 [Opitutales bacterium]
MPSRFLILAGVLVAGLNSGLTAAPTATESALVFNNTLPKNDLKGSFAAQVLFAQSQVIPSRPREDDRQPRLISLRKTLVMVRPVRVDSAPIAFNDPVLLTAIDGAGKELGALTLNPPQQLPKTAYFVDGTPVKSIDFTSPAGKVGVIDDAATVAKLAEPNGSAVLELLRGHALVRIETA